MSRANLKRKTVQLSEHAITLAGEEFKYTLRRSNRRSMGLTVGPAGLKVAAPLRAPYGDVLNFLKLHANWIIEKLNHWQQQEQAPQIQLRDGAVFSFLGWPCTLRLFTETGREGYHQLQPEVQAYELHLRQRPERHKIWQAFWRVTEAHALRHFDECVAHYCLQVARPQPVVRLSNALTRWGSCSSRSGIRLSWRLIFLSAAEVEYVIAHEVAHLLEMNHSARFWAVVARLFPDYRTAEVSLRTAGGRVPEFAP